MEGKAYLKALLSETIDVRPLAKVVEALEAGPPPGESDEDDATIIKEAQTICANLHEELEGLAATYPAVQPSITALSKLAALVSALTNRVQYHSNIVEELKALVQKLEEEAATVNRVREAYRVWGDWIRRFLDLAAPKVGRKYAWPTLAPVLGKERMKYQEDCWKKGDVHRRLKGVLLTKFKMEPEEWDCLLKYYKERNTFCHDSECLGAKSLEDWKAKAKSDRDAIQENSSAEVAGIKTPILKAINAFCAEYLQ